MRCLKQATLILALLGAIVLAGCGINDTTTGSSYNNGSGNQPYKPKTHLTHRSIVSNYYAGALDVMDATEDRLTSYTFAVGSEPTYLQPSPDGTLTLVNNTESNSISSFNNLQEKVWATIPLGGYTQSFVTSMNNEFGYAAVPNVSNGNPPNLPGGIVGFNPSDGSLNPEIEFPYVQYLAMDTAEQHLLAFTQGSAPTVGVTDIQTITGAIQVSLSAPVPALAAGQQVTIAGNSNSEFNGNCTIASVLPGNQQFTCTGSFLSGSGSGGTATFIANEDDTAHWVDLTTNDPATGVPPYYSLSLTTAVPISRPVAAFFSTNSTNGPYRGLYPELRL